MSSRYVRIVCPRLNSIGVHRERTDRARDVDCLISPQSQHRGQSKVRFAAWGLGFRVKGRIKKYATRRKPSRLPTADTCQRLLLNWATNLGAILEHMLKCHRWLRGSLMCTICYHMPFTQQRQNKVSVCCCYMFLKLHRMNILFWYVYVCKAIPFPVFHKTYLTPRRTVSTQNLWFFRRSF
jgi:hypothetical protein